jgi:hypothetical protein
MRTFERRQATAWAFFMSGARTGALASSARRFPRLVGHGDYLRIGHAVNSRSGIGAATKWPFEAQKMLENLLAAEKWTILRSRQRIRQFG